MIAQLKTGGVLAEGIALFVVELLVGDALGLDEVEELAEGAAFFPPRSSSSGSLKPLYSSLMHMATVASTAMRSDAVSRAVTSKHSPMILKWRNANVDFVLLLLNLEEVDRRFAHATMDVPQHALDIVVLLDDAGLELVFEAIVAEIVVERLVVGPDLSNLAAMRPIIAMRSDSFSQGPSKRKARSPSLYQTSKSSCFAIASTGKYILLNLGIKLLRVVPKTLVKSIVQDVISPLWGSAIP